MKKIICLILCFSIFNSACSSEKVDLKNKDSFIKTYNEIAKMKRSLDEKETEYVDMQPLTVKRIEPVQNDDTILVAGYDYPENDYYVINKSPYQLITTSKENGDFIRKSMDENINMFKVTWQNDNTSIKTVDTYFESDYLTVKKEEIRELKNNILKEQKKLDQLDKDLSNDLHQYLDQKDNATTLQTLSTIYDKKNTSKKEKNIIKAFANINW